MIMGQCLLLILKIMGIQWWFGPLSGIRKLLSWGWKLLSQRHSVPKPNCQTALLTHGTVRSVQAGFWWTLKIIKFYRKVWFYFDEKSKPLHFCTDIRAHAVFNTSLWSLLRPLQRYTLSSHITQTFWHPHADFWINYVFVYHNLSLLCDPGVILHDSPCSRAP